MPTGFYRHLCLHYNTYSLIANTLIALSIAGLSLLGVLTTILTSTVLIVWAIIFAGLFGIGKLLDQEVDDLDKVKAHQGRCSDEQSNHVNTGDTIDSKRVVKLQARRND